ncbi:hypothetical protein GRF29_106g1775370 [Pseudopithomyces chartarum]|uniref:Uncharacterized protein n=1 Tax=Pseudopithomyces chartarum TaxID=1892770 RepID=A0AAN6LUR1_9PLEO|nr:hypothetical protein GRF29_106g1775370 [Pseudopithomyces chartarum]
MRHFPLLIGSSLVPSAYALGRALLINQCDQSIYITPSDSSSNEPIPLGVNGSLTHPITADLTTLAVQLVAEPATNVTWRSAISFSASDSTLEYSVFNLRGRAFADHPITVTPKPDREDCPSATFGYRDNKNAKGTVGLAGHLAGRGRPVAQFALEIIIVQRGTVQQVTFGSTR